MDRKKVKAILQMCKTVTLEIAGFTCAAAFFIARCASGTVDMALLWSGTCMVWIALCAYYHLWYDALARVTKSLTGLLIDSVLKSPKGGSVSTKKPTPPQSFLN